MSIVVQCPHCETKFNLQPDMIGKSMRCPNLDCRKVFTVVSQGRPVEPPRSEPVTPPSKPRTPAKATRPERPRPTKIVEGEVVDAAVVVPPKVKEVVWSEGTDAPPPKGTKSPRPPVAQEPESEPDPDDFTLIPRRKKKKNRGPVILIGMAVSIIALIGFGVIYVLRFQGLSEAKLSAQAEEEYQKGDYAAAAKSFEQLAADDPEGENTPRYKFFSELAATQVVVRAVTNREEPDAAVKKLKAFIEAQKASPFAKPTSGYGRDILEAGKKLSEDLAAHADDRMKAFRGDRSQSGELTRAEQTIATGRDLLSTLEPFRAPDDVPLDTLRKSFEDVEREVKRERDRTAAIVKATKDLDPLTDAAIQAVEADLASAGLSNDAEAENLLAQAKGRLRDQVKYEADPAAPRAPPTSTAATLLFVSPVGPTRLRPAGAVEELPPTVFLTVARGILYAIDEEAGILLWAVRVGPDVTDPPTVVRVELDDGPTDLALITSNVGGEAALMGYVVRPRPGTEPSRWYQPLPAPAAGPAAVVGTRAYVPVRDEYGTIYVFDITTGERRGRIRMGQPAGPALVVRPGTGLIYATADARRLYVIDGGAKDDDGNLLPPRCVQVIATGHPAGTLRTPPLLLGPPGEAPGERWIILSQADGPTTMLLRAFTLLPVQPLPADGKLPPETPATPAVELTVPGWSWFPPTGDGERIALATDAGQFRLFGVNQPGSFDKALFPISTPALPTPPAGTAIPGLVFPAEEGTFWVLASGALQKYRIGLVPSRGLEVIPVGPSLPLGVPTQMPQFNGRNDAVCLVVRSLTSASYKAVLVNLRDGELRWQRQLGVVPAAPPIPQPDGLLLVAEDGGLVLTPTTTGAAAGRNLAAPATWVIAAAPENVTAPTAVAVSADLQTLFTVTPVLSREDQKLMPKYVIRRVSAGKVVHEGSVTAPGTLVGVPIIVGDALLIPVSDGIVYRHVPGTGRVKPDTLVPGPPWSSERRSADSSCYLTPLAGTAFLTNDASKKLARWDWPATGGWNPAGAWEMRERPAGPGLLLSAGGPMNAARLLIADVTGSVWLYPGDRGGQHLRRWRPGSGLPAGKPTSPFVLHSGEDGKVVVAYTVENRYLVSLNPEQELPLWSTRSGESAEGVLVGPPQALGNTHWLVTELSGGVTLFDQATGKASATLGIGLPGAVPATSASALGTTAVLIPLSDASSVVLPLPEKAPMAPAPSPGK